MEERVLALDPGMTTGYAILNLSEKTVGVYQKAMDHQTLYDFLFNSGPTAVVCEDFEYRRGEINVVLYPVELIGIVKLFCQNQGRPLFMQKAMHGKAYWSDAKLQEAGLYVKGLQHGRDATRHLLHWVMFGAGGAYLDLDKETLCLI